MTHDRDRAQGPATGDLVLALDAGRIGSWRWDMASGRTTWDVRLEELHGLRPGEFGGTFEHWFATLHPEDRDECVARVDDALARRGPYTLLHRTTWADGSVHWIECRGVVTVDDRGEPTGTTGVAFDVTQHKVREEIDAERIARRQRMVDTLQLALLPSDPPTVDGVTIASRYVSAQGPGEVGGDWYSLIPLPGTRLGVAIGDVAGHGLAAVAEMAGARFGVRALAVDDPPPAHLLAQMSRNVRVFERDTMITGLYGILDPVQLTWTYANAGHCAPIIRQCDGTVTALPPASDPPLGFGAAYDEAVVPISPGATVVLYTDGLVERRGENLDTGIERLVAACATGPGDGEALCDHLLERMLHDVPNEDDVALVVLTLD